MSGVFGEGKRGGGGGDRNDKVLNGEARPNHFWPGSF